MTDSNSVCGRLLGSTPATQRYKGRLGGIRTQDFADISGGGLREHTSRLLPDSRLLHTREAHSHSVGGRLLGSTPATPRYKGRPCRMKAQDFADFSG